MCERVRYLRSWISQCYEVDECAKITQVTGRLFASILSGGPRLPQFQSIDSDLKRTLCHAFRKIRFLADPDLNFDIVQFAIKRFIAICISLFSGSICMYNHEQYLYNYIYLYMYVAYEYIETFFIFDIKCYINIYNFIFNMLI